MKILTLTCADCGTIVAANELERRRVMHCPGLGCTGTLRFADLPEAERAVFLENRDRYHI